MGGDDDGCARSDWSGVTKLPQEALLWRDVSDLSAIDLSAIDLSARLGGSNDFSVCERELGAPSFSIAAQDLPEMVVTATKRVKRRTSSAQLIVGGKTEQLT